MSTLISFDFEGEAVRAVTIEGDPYLVGKDVCGRLEYMNPAKAMKDHCRGVTKRYPIVDSLGRRQMVRVLSEPDVLRLILSSKLPAAERFERWIFETVLPEIRRTGRFGGASAKSELDSVLALARSCELVRRTYGRAAAQLLWAEMGGMPLPIDDEGVVKRHPAATKAAKRKVLHAMEALPSSKPVSPFKAARDARSLKIVQDFICEACTRSEASEVQALPLYQAYDAWAVQLGQRPMSQTRFGRTMRLAGFEKSKAAAIFYLGLRLKPGMSARIP